MFRLEISTVNNFEIYYLLKDKNNYGMVKYWHSLEAGIILQSSAPAMIAYHDIETFECKKIILKNHYEGIMFLNLH